MSTPYGYVRLTENINVGTGHEKRLGDIIPCATKKIYLDMLTCGEHSEKPNDSCYATEEQIQLENFLSDAEEHLELKKFGISFTGGLQYYGINLGKKEIDVEDEKGKTHKSVVPLNYILTGDRRVYRVLGNKCSTININFKNITSLDRLYSMSPGALRNFCEGGLNIIQAKNPSLTSLTSVTQPSHTHTHNKAETQKKTEIGSQDSLEGQGEILTTHNMLYYINIIYSKVTPQNLADFSGGVLRVSHDSQGSQGEKEPVLDNVQSTYYECPVFSNDSDLSQEVKHFITKTSPNQRVEVPLKTLIYTIRCKLKHYIGLPDEGDYDLMALFVLGTYIYPVFPAFPYLQVNAIKESGKSRLLGVLGKLCFASLYTASQRPSPLFRYIDGNGGTIIFDEAEGISLDPDKIQIINAGYKLEGGGVLLTDKNNHKIQEEFDTYGPKIFGSINNLPDTVITRCIRIAIEKSNLDIYDERLPEYDDDFKYIRDLLYVFGLSHGLAVQKVFLEKHIKIEGVRHRYWEMYKPLAAIAYYAGEDYYKQIISYIEGKVSSEKRRRLYEDEDAIAMSALVRLIKSDEFYSIAQITAAIREEIGAQDIKRKDQGTEYITHYDESFKHINGRWVTNFLRNVNLPTRRKEDKDDGRHGGARGRYFIVADVIDKAIRMNVVETVGGENILITTGEHVWNKNEPKKPEAPIQETKNTSQIPENLDRSRTTRRAVARCFLEGKTKRQEINFTSMMSYGGDIEFIDKAYIDLREAGFIQAKGEDFVLLKPIEEFKKFVE